MHTIEKLVKIATLEGLNDKIIDILDTYGIDEETEEYFEEFIVLDYINTNQRDNELANKNLMNNLNNDFKFLNITDKMILKN